MAFKDVIKCTYEYPKGVICGEVAIEKWTSIPYRCPYTTPAEANEVGRISYMCDRHSDSTKTTFGDILSLSYIIEKILFDNNNSQGIK